MKIKSISVYNLIRDMHGGNIVIEDGEGNELKNNLTNYECKQILKFIIEMKQGKHVDKNILPY